MITRSSCDCFTPGVIYGFNPSIFADDYLCPVRRFLGVGFIFIFGERCLVAGGVWEDVCWSGVVFGADLDLFA